MSSQRHIVRRQLIELEIPARMDRVDIQNRVARLFYDRMVPMLDRHLSKHSHPERTDKIEKLEIDLGRLHISRLEKDVLEKIEAELKAQLEPMIMELESLAAVELNKKPAKGSDIELITYFFQTGAFPWWAVEATMSALEQAFENLGRSQQTELRRVLNHLFHDDRILQRCLYACSENILERIVRICFPGEAARLLQAKQDVSSSLGALWNEPGLKQIWWYCVIRSAIIPASEKQADIVPGIVQLFMRLSGLSLKEMKGLKDFEVSLNEESTQSHDEIQFQKESDAIHELNSLFSSMIASSSFNALSKAHLKKILIHLKNIEEAIENFDAENGRNSINNLEKALQEFEVIQKFVETIDDHSISSDHSQIKRKNDENERQLIELDNAVERIGTSLIGLEKGISSRTPDRMNARLKRLWQRPAEEVRKIRKHYDPFNDSDKVYVQNAGLVLLWPFLNRFFINLELADDKAFASVDAAERACLFLQYLVDGDAENIFEAQLPLNKIICGVEMDEPVNTQLVMDEDEREVSDGFLEAVIQNAPLWKNLSPDGLRQAYLQREGVLGTRDGHWLLQVKRETYDVMVDRLPWTIQVVKLPWMEHLIFVEWQQS